jgi:hypothetical protein
MFDAGIKDFLSFDLEKEYEKLALDCLQWADESADAQERQWWNAFALEFLRLAADERNLRK